MEMDWTRGQTIGRGSSATVSIAKAKCSGQVFAVKSAELSDSHSLKKEQSFLSALRCPQVISCKGFDITNENGKFLYNLFLEYAPGGTLLDAIRKHGGCLDEGMIRSFTRTILLGLHHLHSNGIVHCDIKGHNILVTADGVKIADLGCARRVDEVLHADWATMTPIAGTPAFMAPEVARGEHQGFPADVWALGCTVVEMATGKAPWVNISDPVSALYQIGFSGEVPEIPSFMSTQARDFLSKCLKRDPTERWSASELLKHDFIIEEPNFVSKEINTSSLVTPTSVLNQCLWDSVEELETIWKSTHKSWSDSPIERIGQLTESNGKVPNWAWDDTWVTVRSNNSTQEQEMSGSSQDYDLAYANETDRVLLSEGYDLVIPNEPTRICGLNTCNVCSSSSSSDSCWHKILLMLCKCIKDAFCGRLNFTKIISFCFLHCNTVLAHASLGTCFLVEGTKARFILIQFTWPKMVLDCVWPNVMSMHPYEPSNFMLPHSNLIVPSLVGTPILEI